MTIPSIKKFLLTLGAAVIACSLAGCLKTSQQTIVVPIELTDASNLGGIQFELTFDANILKVVDVKKGTLGTNSSIAFNADNPGRVMVAVVDSKGIGGSGPVAIARFTILKPGQQCAISLENIKAHDASTLASLYTKYQNGYFGGKQGSIITPMVDLKQ